ncbi:MAG: substrate-binding domain-containing protein [Anaerolineae bacterium]|nr:substrate-binding domain-containing protein [Anaerolineae bacterium]
MPLQQIRRMTLLFVAVLAGLALWAALSPTAPTYAQDPTATATAEVTEAATSAPTVVPTVAPTTVPTTAPTEAATVEATPESTAETATSANTITVDGSQIVSPILRTVSTNYKAIDPNTTVDVVVSGTGGGFEKLCNGTLDINMASRPITDAEIAACGAKGVNFVELLLGYDAVVLIVNATSPVSCVSLDQVNKLIGPNAQGVNNWNATDPSQADSAISALYITTPADSQSQVRTLVDAVLAGDGIRPDLTVATDSAEILTKVAAETGAVGVLTLKEWNRASSQGVKALQLRNSTTCIDPTVPNLDEGRYLGGESLFLYVNAASLDRQPVSAFLTYLLGTNGRRVVGDSGFVSASTILYDRGINYINNKQTGRTFSRIQSVNLPADTAGTVTVDGSPSVFAAVKAISSTFQPRYAQIVINTAMYGDEAGFRKLCLNTIDIVGATRQINDTEAQACQNAGVQFLRLFVGYRSLVVVVNGNNTFAQCLKAEEVQKLFGGAATAKTWKEVNDTFPETPLLLLAPTLGDSDTDLLLRKLTPGQTAPYRRLSDVTENNDALYRAAATKNVEGAVTFMTYADYQAALKQNMAIKAVSLDSGSGCVEPTEANITAGTYAVSEPLYLYLNTSSFTRPEVRAFVWYLLSDDALTSIGKQGLVGVDTNGFVAARDLVLERFTAVSTPVPTLTPVATTATTAEATAAATTEATTAATAEVTVEATAEATATPAQ